MAMSLVVPLPNAPVFVGAMAVVAAGQRLLATTTCGCQKSIAPVTCWLVSGAIVGMTGFGGVLQLMNLIMFGRWRSGWLCRFGWTLPSTWRSWCCAINWQCRDGRLAGRECHGPAGPSVQADLSASGCSAVHVGRGSHYPVLAPAARGLRRRRVSSS